MNTQEILTVTDSFNTQIQCEEFYTGEDEDFNPANDFSTHTPEPEPDRMQAMADRAPMWLASYLEAAAKIERARSRWAMLRVLSKTMADLKSSTWPAEYIAAFTIAARARSARFGSRSKVFLKLAA